ncbi:hypothetical protein [Bdellovibrio svalbardensis]|uniref:Secreted protein n=1 Tax=Bdellovibrio svalbardensis TaxID=2972972 RepID=A0ABT6DG15_9BACT|nr:hypothetical protein [Bdellovibrio svalbardensis]MDG0815782.1 hypothetical protein [Bdellovibrio svalbardensis]
MKALIALVCVCFLSSLSHGKVMDDGQVTNGGDAYVAEFFLVLDSALSRMPLTIPLENNVALDRHILEVARTKVQISSEESLQLDGREVSAVNQPFTSPPTIKVSRSSWKTLSEAQKTQLVIHELFPIVGVFDADYKNSTAVIRLIDEATLISYPALQSAVDRCDTSIINAIPEEAFMRMTTQNQKNALLVQALNQRCSALVQKYSAMNINMDICIGAISLMNWHLRVDFGETNQSIEILKLLSEAKVPSVKTCSARLNDSCDETRKIVKSWQKNLVLNILQCN